MNSLILFLGVTLLIGFIFAGGYLYYRWEHLQDSSDPNHSAIKAKALVDSLSDLEVEILLRRYFESVSKIDIHSLFFSRTPTQVIGHFIYTKSENSGHFTHRSSHDFEFRYEFLYTQYCKVYPPPVKHPNL